MPSQGDEGTPTGWKRLRAVMALICFLGFMGSWAVLAAHFLYFMAIWSSGAVNPTYVQNAPIRSTGSVRYVTPEQDGRRNTLHEMTEYAGWTMFGSFVFFVLLVKRFSLVDAGGRLSPEGAPGAGRA